MRARDALILQLHRAQERFVARIIFQSLEKQIALHQV
jgi:hypothetical protein